MRNTPTGFITIPSLLGSPAALRSPNRRAPSPTKVPAQWASGRCKKLGCATGAVSPGGPGIGTSRSFIYIYVFIYIYISQPQKDWKGKFSLCSWDLMIWCVYLFSYTHTHQYHIKSYSKPYHYFYTMMKTSGNWEPLAVTSTANAEDI